MTILLLSRTEYFIAGTWKYSFGYYAKAGPAHLLGKAQAIEEMKRCSPEQFDPKIVDIF